jgi:ABC-type multidrug transport system fused ATPase/permease subunit
MLLASFAEILSIGAVLPFLAVLISPERVFVQPDAKTIIQILGLTEPEQLLLPLTVAFTTAIVIAASIRLLLLWVSIRLSFAVGADLGISIYRRTLFQPYSVHVSRNSSEVISGISYKAKTVIYGFILPALALINASVMLITIFIALLVIEPIIALVAFGGFGLMYAIIIRLTRRKLLSDSQCMARESVQVIKALQEGLGGIRDVLVDGNQEIYCGIYRNADLRMRRAQGNVAFISASPRHAVEALGMTLIITLAYFLAQQSDGIGRAIPTLGALALGAMRLLPVLQQAYGSWTTIQGGYASLQDTIDLLDQPLPEYANQPAHKALSFKRYIKLKDIGFRYNSESSYVLKEINLSIPKGERVGFIGTTGGGKSTLLDIIMGLLEPTDGNLEIDGRIITPSNNRAWQAHIAHVPQVIYLADSTIEENIAFGVPKDQINHDRVREAARQAQIADSIEGWPNQYRTLVGERGIRLSGGQRQRIGIARALYKNADVIIFDEATSALDNDTEQSVMSAIEHLGNDLTLLIIAHRLTTLKCCSQIVELGGGTIKRIGSYRDIVSQLNPAKLYPFS